MEKLYTIITKDKPEARLPRTTVAIYTNRKKAAEMVDALRKSDPDVIWDMQEWQKTLIEGYIPRDI